MKFFLSLALLFLFLSGCVRELPPPNILWITVEDMSPNLGSYGDPFAHTPTLDALADQGVIYTNAIATAPVCAVARSTIISGMYATSIGTHHMRCDGQLPEGTELYPTYLREAGYYATNNAKTDYNLAMDHTSIWDESSQEAHWRNRPDSTQPFFAIFNFTTTHESRVNNENTYLNAIAHVPDELLKEPGDVPLPPYYPDTEDVQALWARYYNIITAMDLQVADLLAQLEEDGLRENTIIFFYSDHGAGIPRHKRWLFDSGLRIPLIVYTPERYAHLNPYSPGSQTDELVSFIDLPATALHLAGVPLPKNYQGRPFLGEGLAPMRSYVYAARDRMDERYDIQRAVRNKRYKYIRYYEPFKPYTQYMNTPEKGAIMMAIRGAGYQGLPLAGQHILANTKPEEALYDLETDPHELSNLVDDDAYREALEELREAHAGWSDQTKDAGLIPETILRQWEAEEQQSIYTILRQKNVDITLIRETAVGNKPVSELLELISHDNEVVRYWAAVSLGNQAGRVSSFAEVENALEDPVPAVRIAAARAAGLMQRPAEALPVLTGALGYEDEWVRLYAAQVLDELGEPMRPAIPSMREAMNDPNKYVVRVVNHALNALEGTSNVVP